MSVLDYYDANAVSRYPLKDNATLGWTSSGLSGYLPNDVVLDVAFSVFNGIPYSPSLFQISYTYNTNPANDSWVLTIKLNSSITVSLNVVYTGNKYTAVYTDSTIVVRVVLDTVALSSFFRGLFTANDVLTFDNTNVFCTAGIRLNGAGVSSFIFANNVAGSPSSIGTFSAPSISGGSNLSILNENGNPAMSVLAGAGTGLRDICTQVQGLLTQINGITADAAGNLNLVTSHGLNLDTTSSNTVQLTSSSRPECTPAEMANFAYYLNRIQDGANQLGNLVTQTLAIYDTTISNYTVKIEADRALKPAYLKVESSRTANAVDDYITVNAAIYSANVQPIPVQLAVTVGGQYTVVEDSIYTVQAGVKLIGATAPGLANAVLQCSDQLSQRFVVTSPKTRGVSAVNSGTDVFDVQFQLRSPNATAGYGLPLIYTKPNFNWSYTSINDGKTKTIQLALSLIGPAVALNTSLALGYPSSLGYGASKLVLNNHVNTGSTLTTGFQNLNVDFSTAAVYYATLTTPATTTGTLSVPVQLTTAMGSVLKSITITL